jgi:hypothetical protein
MTAIACLGCGSGTPDGLLCTNCTRALLSDLETLPEWLSHLDDVLARQTQTGTGNGGRKGETPVPYDDRASEVLWIVRNTLVGLVRELHRVEPWPVDTCPAMVVWLHARVDRIRGHAAAGELAGELGNCVVLIMQVVDTRGPTWYLGPCTEPCTRVLYAPRGATVYRCPQCATLIDVDARRRELFASVLNEWASLEQCVTVLDVFGLPAELGYIRRWVATGHLVGVDGRYRVGDVADIARDQVIERAHG